MSAQAKEALAVGDRLVSKTFPPITRHRLALYCGASGDHNPIHVDLDFAKAAGFEDVFAHGMLVMAYLGQALTDAVAPSAIRSFSTRFSAIPSLALGSPVKAASSNCSKPTEKSGRGWRSPQKTKKAKSNSPAKLSSRSDRHIALRPKVSS